MSGATWPQDMGSWYLPTIAPRSRVRPNRVRRSLAVMIAAVGLAGTSVGGGAVGAWVYERSAASRSASSFADEELDVAAVLSRVQASVVAVRATVAVHGDPSDGTETDEGTGIVLTVDGQILTNAHVVASASSIRVVLPGSLAERPAELLALDMSADIALLAVRDAGPLTPAPLARSQQPHVGDEVVAIGNALALEGGMTVTAGIVSALDRTIRTDDGVVLRGLLQTDAAISSGNSGGPLVDAAGRVVGITTAAATGSDTVEAENIGFAIPIGIALETLARIRG